MRMWALVKESSLITVYEPPEMDNTSFSDSQCSRLPTVATSRLCVRTGTGESLIKIVPGNAEKDKHMAVSESWVTLSR